MLTNLRPRLKQLSEPIQSLLERDFRRRPTVQELLTVSAFSSSFIQCHTEELMHNFMTKLNFEKTPVKSERERNPNLGFRYKAFFLMNIIQ